MQTDGKRVDKHGEADIRFLQFCERTQKKCFCGEVIRNLYEFIVQDFINLLEYYPISPWVHVMSSRGSVQTFMAHFSAD